MKIFGVERKYVLHGFYQTDLSLGLHEPKFDDTSLNFTMEFEYVEDLTDHINRMNLIKGTYTFIIEVKEEYEHKS